MKNLNYVKKQIRKKEWTHDCCGKQDLDLSILSIRQDIGQILLQCLLSYWKGMMEKIIKYYLNPKIISKAKVKKVAKRKLNNGILII